MIPTKLQIKIKSAVTFGRGDGVAGWVDREIEYDAEGFPYLRGKTLKGLLVEAAENVVFALKLQGREGWSAVKDTLFGKAGRGVAERGRLHLGDACLPEKLHTVIKMQRLAQPIDFSVENILYALTAVRRQTAMNPDGGPEFSSLRSNRVLLPTVMLEAPLSFEGTPSDDELQLLVAAVMDLRHAGTTRNRGRGWIKVELDNADITRQLFLEFAGGLK